MCIHTFYASCICIEDIEVYIRAVCACSSATIPSKIDSNSCSEALLVPRLELHPCILVTKRQAASKL